MQLTQSVLDSPAVAVLCDLEHAGLDLAVVDGHLRDSEERIGDDTRYDSTAAHR